MAQISRLKDAEISNGNLINADDIDAEFNQLVSQANTQDTELTAIGTGAYTFSGVKTFSSTPKMNAIDERTAGSGVTADSVLLKDGMVTVAGAATGNGMIGYASNQFQGYRNGSLKNFLMAGDSAAPVSVTSDITGDPTPGLANAGTYYSCSGTFSVTFAAVATLGDLWYAYFANDGTGIVTLDANSTETFQWGPATPTTVKLYPGDTALIVCDGSELKVFGLRPYNETSGQTITSGGTLTIAHGLGAKPREVWAVLKCTDAGGDAGFAQNEEIVVWQPTGAATSRGVTIWPDATNLNVRFGSAAAVFYIVSDSSGNESDLVNTKWQLIIRSRL